MFRPGWAVGSIVGQPQQADLASIVISAAYKLIPQPVYTQERLLRIVEVMVDDGV